MDFWVTFRIFRTLCESVQIMALGTDERFGWDLSVSDSGNAAQFDFTGDVYYETFLVVATTLTVFVVGGVFGILLQFGACCGNADEIVWWFFLQEGVFGVFLIPFSNILLQIFHCEDVNGTEVLIRDPSMKCWEGDHIGLVVWSCFCIIMMTAGFFFRANVMQQAGHRRRGDYSHILHGLSFGLEADFMRHRHDVHYYDTKYMIFRLFLVIISLWVTDESTTSALVSMLVCSLFLLADTIWLLPHVEMKWNYLKVALFAFPTWTFFISLFVDSTGKDACFGWFGVLAFLPLCFYLAQKRLDSRPLNEPVEQDPKQAELIKFSETISKEGHITIDAAVLAGGTFSSFAEAVEGSNFSDDTEGVYFKNPDKSHETEEVTQTQIQNLVDATRNCSIRLLRLNSWNLNSGHVKWLAPMLLKVEVLDLCDNKLGKDGVLKVIEIVKSNANLQKVLLYENGLMAKHRNDIEPSLEENGMKEKFKCFG